MQIIGISDIYGDSDSVHTLITKLDDKLKASRIIIVAGDVGISKGNFNYIKNVEKILRDLTSVSRVVMFVPGDSDDESFTSSVDNVINLDHRNHVIHLDGMKIGLLGLGGAPTRSVRNDKFSSYLWDDDTGISREVIMNELKINFEKILLQKLDCSILVTHSPPYGVADYGSVNLYDLSSQIEVDDEFDETPKPEIKKIKSSHHKIGSKIIKEFVDLYKPDIHIFGHSHKEGGKFKLSNSTQFFNVSHLSGLPYKLTSRKYFVMDLSVTQKNFTFKSAVNSNMSFEDFLETYI